MLMIFPQSQRGLDPQQECMNLTSSNRMLLFRPMQNTFEMPLCWLKELLTNRLSWTPKSLYGLPTRIGTSFSPALMRHTIIW